MRFWNWWRRRRKRRRAKYVELTITELGTRRSKTYVLRGVIKMASIQRDDDKGVSYGLGGWKDAKGQPAAAPTLAGPPTWVVTEADPTGAALPAGTLVTFTPSGDGLTATAVPTGNALGTATINVSVPASADGSFPGGSGSTTLQVVADVAKTVTITETPIS